jgi:protein associated with RNAse G/E
VVITPPGTEIFTGREFGWVNNYLIRTFFSYNHPVNVLEVLESDGTPVEIYANVASAAKHSVSGLFYTDFELDVVRYLKSADGPTLVDEDELQRAIEKYSLAADLVSEIVRVGEALLGLIENWDIDGQPEASLEYLDQFMSKNFSCGRITWG